MCGKRTYRIDLGVVDPRDPARYVLGIECDGVHYASASTARDRDRLRAQVLRGLGWRLHRVWTPDWVRDRDREVGRIADAIAAALTGKAEPAATISTAPITATVEQRPATLAASGSVRPMPSASGPAASIQDDSPLRRAQESVAAGSGVLRAAAGREALHAPEPSSRMPYQPAPLPRLSEDPGQLYDDRWWRHLSEIVVQVARAESPVHVDVLGRRVIGVFGMAKLTAKARQRIDEFARRAEKQGSVARVGDFLWAPQYQRDLDSFRELGDRGLDEVAPEEIAAAGVYVLARNLSLGQEDLFREIAALYGLQRLGKNVVASLEAGLRVLVDSRRATTEGERVVWAGAR